jgi:hypothetical protein
MSLAVAPAGWAAPTTRRPSVAAVFVAFAFAIVGFLIASVGFALPMALRVLDGGHAVYPAADVALLRSMASDGGVIFVVGIVHAVVGLAILAGSRTARAAAAILASTAIVVSVIGFFAAVAAWGPFAGTGLARPGSPRMDGVGITLAVVFIEALVLIALRAAEQSEREAI